MPSWTRKTVTVDLLADPEEGPGGETCLLVQKLLGRDLRRLQLYV